MRNRSIGRWTGAAGVLGLISLGAWASMRIDRAQACAPAMAEGAVVRVAREEALIVWDAEHRTEHFIRRADFATDADDFGFLVPTPSPPQLAEVPGQVFESLRLETAPEEVTETDWTVVTCCTSPFLLLLSSASDAAPLEASAVTVLHEQRVAGMNATVVTAEDPDALGAWLGEHGYENRPALVEWLAPYVERGFAITAFRYVADGGQAASRAVRMTFSTDRPFYPYREPADQPESYGRSLRVWLVGPQRMNAEAWNASPEYAAPVHPTLVSGTVPDALPNGVWLSSFFDASPHRRGADDAFFEPVPNQELAPPPLVNHRSQVVPAPVEPVVVLLAGIWIWRRRRQRAAPQDERPA